MASIFFLNIQGFDRSLVLQLFILSVTFFLLGFKNHLFPWFPSYPQAFLSSHSYITYIFHIWFYIWSTVNKYYDIADYFTLESRRNGNDSDNSCFNSTLTQIYKKNTSYKKSVDYTLIQMVMKIKMKKEGKIHSQGRLKHRLITRF